MSASFMELIESFVENFQPMSSGNIFVSFKPFPTEEQQLKDQMAKSKQEGDFKKVLFCAIELEDFECIDSLLKEKKVELTVRDGSGFTPFLAAAYHSHPKLMEYFLKMGSSVNEVDSDGNNAVLLIFKHLFRFQLFSSETKKQENLKKAVSSLDFLFNLSSEAKEREALFKHFNKNHENIFHIIFNSYSYSYTNIEHRENIINLALKCHDHFRAHLLEPHSDHASMLNAVNACGDTLLHKAVKEENQDLVEKLLKIGVDPYLKDAEGNLAWMIAVKKLNLKIFDLLKKETKCDLEERNKAGDTALLAAIRNGDYNVTRFLIEQGANIEAKDKSENKLTARQLALTTPLKDCPKLLALLHPDTKEKSLEEYSKLTIEERMLRAIDRKDIEQIRYLAKVYPNSLEANDEKERRAMDHAVLTNELEVVKVVYELLQERFCCESCSDCEDCDFCDKHSVNFQDNEGNTPLKFAVINDSFPIAQFLIDKGAYIEAETKDNIEPIQLAQKLGRNDIVNYMKKTLIEEERKEAIDTLSIPPGPLTLDCFVEKLKDIPTLATKGSALMAHHNKLKHGKNIFIAQNREALVHALKLLNQSKNGTELTLIYRFRSDDFENFDVTDAHRVSLKLERCSNINHVIFIDSVTCYSHLLQALLKEELKDVIESFCFYPSSHGRQIDDISCPIFATKDAFKLSRSTQLHHDLIRGKYITDTEEESGLTTRSFKLPAEFMAVCQSPDRFYHYLKEDPVARFLNIYPGKDGEYTDLDTYSHKPREIGSIKTPELIKNRNFTSKEKTPGQQEFIKKNKNIAYFREKYTSKILPEMLKRYSEEQLVNIIAYHNAENLCLTPGKAIVPKCELKEATEREERELIAKLEKIHQQSTLWDNLDDDTYNMDDEYHSFDSTFVFGNSSHKRKTNPLSISFSEYGVREGASKKQRV